MKSCLRALLCFSLPLTTVLAQAQTLEGDAKLVQASVVSAERKSMDMLTKFQDPKSVLWLDAQGEEFLGLYNPALRGKASGSVLLLHAEGQHPDWPGSLAFLRKRLAELGWNTLAIALPDPSPIPIQTAVADNTPATEVLDETEEVFDPITGTVSDGTVIPEPKQSKRSEAESEARAVERIVAAIDQLKSQGDNNVVLYGQGLGALRAGRYWQETGDNAVKALIFVDGQNAIADSEFQLTTALTNPLLPLLDIVHSRSIKVELDAKQRAEQAAMMEMKAYQQHWFAENNEQTANMIYGFLRRHVAK
jgi:dienelactone hydrolase